MADTFIVAVASGIRREPVQPKKAECCVNENFGYTQEWKDRIGRFNGEIKCRKCLRVYQVVTGKFLRQDSDKKEATS